MKKKMINLMSRGLVLVTALATLSLASCDREKPQPELGVEVGVDDQK